MFLALITQGYRYLGLFGRVCLGVRIFVLWILVLTELIWNSVQALILTFKLLLCLFELNLDLHDHSEKRDCENQHQEYNYDNISDVFGVYLLKLFWFFLLFYLFGFFLYGRLLRGKSNKNIWFFIYDGSIFEKLFIIELNLQFFHFILILIICLFGFNLLRMSLIGSRLFIGRTLVRILSHNLIY